MASRYNNAQISMRIHTAQSRTSMFIPILKQYKSSLLAGREGMVKLRDDTKKKLLSDCF